MNPEPHIPGAAATGPSASGTPGAASAGQADAPSTPALSLRGLRKVYDGVEVVHGVDLQIPAGSMYGLVGRNGAGKTTTLSMATGLLRPDGGTALVRGTDVWAGPRPAWGCFPTGCTCSTG